MDYNSNIHIIMAVILNILLVFKITEKSKFTLLGKIGYSLSMVVIIFCVKLAEDSSDGKYLKSIRNDINMQIQNEEDFTKENIEKILNSQFEESSRNLKDISISEVKESLYLVQIKTTKDFKVFNDFEPKYYVSIIDGKVFFTDIG